MVDALQDKHGEVCPANWTEGGKTIKTDPKASLEYFASANANGESGETDGSAKKRARVN